MYDISKKILFVLLVCIVLSAVPAEANGGIESNENNKIELHFITSEFPNLIYKDMDNKEYKLNVKNVILTPTKMIVLSEEKESVHEITDIKYLELTVGEEFDSTYEEMRRQSTLKQKLKYRDPVLINSWITIKGETCSRMIEEILVIKEHLIVQKEPSKLYIYPYINVSDWGIEIVDGKPKDIFRDFIHDLNTHDKMVISKWTSEESDLWDKIPLYANFIPFQEIPLASENYIVNIVLAWNIKDKRYEEQVVTLCKNDGQWILLSWVQSK